MLEWEPALKTISHGREQFPCTPVDIWVTKTDGLMAPEGTWVSKTPRKETRVTKPPDGNGLPVPTQDRHIKWKGPGPRESHQAN